MVGSKASAPVMVVPFAGIQKAEKSLSGGNMHRCTHCILDILSLRRSSWVYGSSRDTNVGALSPEVVREAVTGGTCVLVGETRPGVPGTEAFGGQREKGQPANG